MRLRIFSLLAVLSCAMTASGASTKSASDATATKPPPAVRVVDLKAADGMALKATYFAAPTPGPSGHCCLCAAAQANEMPGGVAQVTQQLTQARRRDPKAQLFPEVTVSIIGADRLRAGDTKPAVEIMQLLVMAYPESAYAHADLADAYLANGRKDLALQHAEKTLALLDSHTTPASSWSDSEPRRSELRRSALYILNKLGGGLKNGARQAVRATNKGGYPSAQSIASIPRTPSA